MRILHFSSAKTWRGGEQQIAYLLEELKAKGIQQWVFCVRGGPMADYCQQHRILHFTFLKIFSVNPFIARQFNQLSTKLKIDLVHLHDAHSHTFAYLSMLLGNKMPMVLSRRVDFPVRNNWFSVKKYNCTNIKKIISVSYKVQSILAPAIQDKSKLEVVHSGVDLGRFNQTNQSILSKTYNLPKDAILIANVAAIAPHKDYFTFVDTAAILLKKYQQLRFFIIGGDGGEATIIRRYIASQGLDKYFFLTGFREDLSELLPEINILLFTSKEEGLGTSIIDALACGVPVVATKAGGISEIIIDEENGLLAPVKDAKSLANQVERILNFPTLKAQLIQKGKQRAIKFSKMKMANKTLTIYQKITGLTIE